MCSFIIFNTMVQVNFLFPFNPWFFWFIYFFWMNILFKVDNAHFHNLKPFHLNLSFSLISIFSDLIKLTICVLKSSLQNIFRFLKVPQLKSPWIHFGNTYNSMKTWRTTIKKNIDQITVYILAKILDWFSNSLILK